MSFDQELRHSSKACPVRTFTKILILKSTYLSWTWWSQIKPTSLKYWRCPKLKLLRSKFETHPFNWIPLRLFSRLHQDCSFKVQINSHKCVGTWNYTGSLVQPAVPVRCLPVSNLPFPFPPTIPTYRSHLPFSPKILNYHSQLPTYHSSSLYYK